MSGVRDQGRKRSIDFKLYLVTDRKILTGRDTLITASKKALKGGVKAIQLREKDLETRKLLELAYKMRNLTEQFRAKLFINDRVDIALATGADGVHLTQSSIPVDVVRKTVKKRLLIGVSTHSLKEAKKAEEGGADFITLGPVYRTPSKLRYGKPVGIKTLKTVCQKTRVPVFAIGGIKNNRILDATTAGAYGVAMISDILAADNIQKKADELRHLLEGKKQAD